MKNNNNNGFSLIELLSAMAIIGIIAALALPEYFRGYIIRPRVLEGIYLAEPVKARLLEVTTIGELNNFATFWNSQDDYNGTNKVSKYVDSIIIDSNNGVITISYNSTRVGVDPLENQITFSPFIFDHNGDLRSLQSALTSGDRGSIDYACASASTVTAQSRGLLSIVTLPTNGMLAKFTPSDCR